ncbi:hypothetical protein [Streptomyces sp. WP-1]|uniref:hypothetical protein n=1 Tax=Streptomyces sp. WP-1 TaxID=3041497 RepID=UPI002649E6E9|nr:hypothetical protein [Streptomyces sp. WP-1]WKE68136.1 hypothetical protein QHG49_03425 [Streptomyces sp. WP-1]
MAHTAPWTRVLLVVAIGGFLEGTGAHALDLARHGLGAYSSFAPRSRSSSARWSSSTPWSPSRCCTHARRASCSAPWR